MYFKILFNLFIKRYYIFYFKIIIIRILKYIINLSIIFFQKKNIKKKFKKKFF